jgi:hypothetical protein
VKVEAWPGAARSAFAFAVLPIRASDTSRLDPQEPSPLGGATHAHLASDKPTGDRTIPLWSILLVSVSPPSWRLLS